MKRIALKWREVAAAAWVAAVLGLVAPARGDWFDSHWPFRRQLEVNWDAQRALGGELATAEFYTSGHDAGATDIRIATEDGHLVASHLLGAGPGDLVRMVFALAPGKTKYYAYFGNPNPDPAPANLQDVKYQCGLLMEMKACPLQRPLGGEQIVKAWDIAGPVLGQAMINQPFYLEDPLSDGNQRLFKLTGAIFSAGETDYYFAGAAYGFGSLCIDGQMVLYMPGAPRMDLYHVSLRLKPGHHDFVIYYMRPRDMGELAISWRLPNSNKLEPIPRTAFGMLGHAKSGELEQYGKTFIADFDSQFEGECFVGDDMSYRYLFTARVPANLAAAGTLHFDWDFGDGVVAGGATMEHVYLTKGVYTVHLTMRSGADSDEQTTNFFVDRERDDSPTQDTPLKQGRILARYDVSKLPEPWLALMTSLERDALMSDAEFAAARRMMSLSTHSNKDACLGILKKIVADLEHAGRAREAVDLLDLAPANSDLQPSVAAWESAALIWWLADFDRALKVSERVADSVDPAGKRAYAEALVLTGNADDARKILDDLQEEQSKAGVRIEAVSGAMARTIEYRLDQSDSETGEQEWETWEQRCPSVFMAGYSVLLRTEMIEQRNPPAPGVAAKIDEAFANAVPNSPYAPALIARAARLVEKSDPAKSRQLKDLLKTRYPEDPLSQK
jgi:PKD repeat protein